MVPTKVMSMHEVKSFDDAMKDATRQAPFDDCKDEARDPEPLKEQILKEELWAMGKKDDTVCASDDVKGSSLDPEMVAAARKLEIEWFHSRDVCTKDPRDQAKGAKIITCVCVDTNMGDSTRAGCGNRLVGKEFANEVDQDLYASMPPLGVVRFAISMASATVPGQEGRCLMVNDTRRAYFLAPTARALRRAICRRPRRGCRHDREIELESVRHP